MTPPSVAVLVAPVVCLTLAAMTLVGICTQPTAAEPDRRITGLVLDGGTVTTTTPLSTAGRPVEPIPHRDLDDITEENDE